MSSTITVKVCSKCNEALPFSEFHKREQGYQASCKACRKDQRKLYSNNYRAWNLMKNYGMTHLDYLTLLDAQDGFCAGCKKHFSLCSTDRGSYLHVDHDHNTGRVRGLLCGKCNKALGLLNDDPEVLHRLASYLGGNDE